MTQLTHGILFVATDIAAEHEVDFNRWYDREHVEERVAIDGFLTGTRYQALGEGKKYLGLYKTRSLESFTSAAYHAAFTRQTAWSVQNLNRMIDPMRRVCAIQARVGKGSGSYLAVCQPETAPSVKQAQQAGKVLAQRDGFVSSSLLTPDIALSTPLPKEHRQNAPIQSIWLLEASSEAYCRQLITDAGQLLSLGQVHFYQLSWQLTAQELGV
ncbi:hypothetical protein EH228_17485 [Erwinia endophytica]|uniref:DUF4286 family protein n=1 Tax=Erwinia endophytica TaxID=1563158 RepID=UPI001265F7C4|nr:DUF4286 family protein [Erwinia endophytica]KAB8306085.1 hypothetical protein EH228_17485 [Erwinia endophytica]